MDSVKVHIPDQRKGEQRPTGLKDVVKEDSENLGSVTIVARMLLPKERISGHRVQLLEILGAKWSKL